MTTRRAADLASGDRRPPPAAASPRDPPEWLLVGLAAAYVLALLAVVLLPGGTLLDRLRTLDAGICAQLPTHSFFPGGQQLPLCARNTGIYLGFTATALVLLAGGRLRGARLPSAWLAVPLGIAVAAMALDGFNSLFRDLALPHLYQPHNLLRLATGLGAGTAMAAFLIPVANDAAWVHLDPRRSFATFGQLAVMLPVLLLAYLAVASQAAWILYPVALLSTAGLVGAIALVNLVIALGASGRLGRIASVRQLAPLAALALGLALAELLALSLLRAWALRALGLPV